MSVPEFLAGETIALAFLWRLTRKDGVVLGFTSHDRSIRVEGILHLASPGMTPSAIGMEDGFRTDGMAISGALSSEAMRAADIDSGRWQGATVELLVCDWRHPGDSVMRLASGRIGDVVRRQQGAGGSFTVELLSDMSALVHGGPPRCSAMCRASLGDARCQVDMDGRAVMGFARRIDEDAVLLDEVVDAPGAYAHGALRFLEGPHAGMDRPVARVEGDTVRLSETVPALGAGRWRVRLREGCDRRFETCAGRFGNAPQFAGEPHVPGTDALLRYGR